MFTTSTRLSTESGDEERISPPPQPPQPPVPVERRLIEAFQNMVGDDPGHNRGSEFKKESVGGIFVNVLLSAPLYPFKLIQILIQLGYEPVQPQKRFSLVFQRYMYYYPGFFGYSRAIVQDDGWSGLYRGITNSLLYSMVSLTTNSILQPLIFSSVNRIPLPFQRSETGDVPDTEPNNSIDSIPAILTRGSYMFASTLLTNVAVEIIVHPLHVITMRNVAQAIGKENAYCGFWPSVVEIYQTQGLQGFYAGLVPALLGHLCTVLIHSSVWLFFEMIASKVTHHLGKVMLKSFVAMPVLAYIPRSYSYPFFLMSNLMAVNNVGLAAGSPPNSPVYGGWRDCYRHLKLTGSLYRGSVVLFSRFAYRYPPVR